MGSEVFGFRSLDNNLSVRWRAIINTMADVSPIRLLHCSGNSLKFCIFCLPCIFLIGHRMRCCTYVARANVLTHWGRVTHICVGKLISIGSDNGLSPGRRQVIIWTNAGILLIGPLGTNFSEILIEIHSFSFKKMYLKCRLRKGDYLVSASMS